MVGRRRLGFVCIGVGLLGNKRLVQLSALVDIFVDWGSIIVS